MASVRSTKVILTILNLRIFIALIIVMVYFSLTTTNFLSQSNLLIMAKHLTVIAVMALGMTLVILTGGIDLSVGSIVGISGMVAGYLILYGLPLGDSVIFFNPVEVALIACLLGAMIGSANGYLITSLGVPPFIATLGTMYIVRGAAMLSNNGATFANLVGHPELGNTGFDLIGNGTFLWLSTPVWILIALSIVTIFIVRKTPLGRHIYAVGGNEQAARFSGIRTNRVRIFVYAFSGFCAAVVGLIITSQLESAHPGAGNTFEMNAIAAVVLGGTSLSGGRGTVIGSIVGSCVICALNDGMVMSGISEFWQMVIKGSVIVLAVVIDQLQQRLQARVLATAG